MGACLGKPQEASEKPLENEGEARLATFSNPKSDTKQEAAGTSDVTADTSAEPARPRSLVSRVLRQETDTHGSKRPKSGSSPRLNGRRTEPERPLQAMSSAELVEQYSIDASVLIKSVARIDQLLKERQAADGQHDSHIGEPIDDSPSVSDHVSSLDAQSLLQLHTTSPRLQTAASPMGLGEAVASSIDSLLSNDPRIATMARDFENGRMLQVQKDLASWCSKHSLQIADLDAYSTILGFRPSEVQKHCAKIDMCLDMMRDDSGYSTARDDGDLRVLYKCKGKAHHIKMESVLPHPLERPLSLAREFDLMNSWNHYITDSQMLLAPSIWQSYVYAAMWMPFPFPQMECLGTGRGYDLSKEDKSLLVAIESIEDYEIPEGAAPIARKTKKRHRADVMPGSSIRFEAMPPAEDGTPRTKGTILQIVNPHVPHVPGFIVNFVLGVLAPFAHRQIVKLLADEFDSPTKPFPQRIAANPQLYQRVRDVVEEGLAYHYGQSDLQNAQTTLVSMNPAA